MKLATKIIALIVLIVVLGIIFYPTDEKHDLRGNWSVSKIIVNGEEKIFGSQVNINENQMDIGDNVSKFYIEEFNIDESYIIGAVSYRYKINNDSLFILSPADTSKQIEGFSESSYRGNNEHKLFVGRYKMDIKTKILGSGKNAKYDTYLNLKTKDKSILLQRITPVRWQTPAKRGQP